MTITMYNASVPVFKQMLTSLSHVLNKAEIHAKEKKIEPEVFLQARLYPDMFSLVRQVQIGADFAKGVCARLANVEVPAYEDNEVSFADLQARIKKTLAFIEALDQRQFDDAATREIVTRPGTPKEKSMRFCATTAWKSAKATTWVFNNFKPRRLYMSRLTSLQLANQDPTNPAAILIERPNIAILNQKLKTDCANAVFLIARLANATSEVCAATAIVKEK